MNQDIFELATINAIAILPEPDYTAIKEATAFIFVETHSIEQIEEMITKLKVFNLAKSLVSSTDESPKWVKLFIESMRQKASEKSIKID